ncbi:MAG: hypothetical protein R3E64_17500 [Halioglobus sp.]
MPRWQSGAFARVRFAVIRPFMPAQHRRFFEQLPMIILGAADLTGDIWATALFGPVGFITTPNDRQLVINASAPAARSAR